MYEDIGAGAGDVIGAIIGEIAGAPNRAEAERLRREAMAQFNIQLPPVEQIQAQAIQSQAAQAQGSQEAKAARMQALRELQRRASEGYTAEDRAAVNDMLSDVATAERGRRQALMSRMDPNSGAAIAAQLSNAQNASQMANRRGLDLAAGSRAAQLRAIAQTGQLGGAIDESEFGQSFARGQASDALSRFNEANRMDASKYNIAQNQQRFSNQFGLAGAKAGQMIQNAAAEENEARRKSGVYRGIGRGVGGTAGYAAGKV